MSQLQHTFEQFDTVTAVFQPLREDDLKPEVRQHIGQTFTFQAGWVIENGQFQGQWAMMPIDPAPVHFGWAPACDLKLLTH